MRVLTVGEVTGYIKKLLEDDCLLGNLWVRGEVSNFKKAPSGHAYFTLKDEYSSLRVVMFRSRLQETTFLPQNGMAVRVRGYISVFERDGQYQLYAEEIEPDGIGALYAALEQLKEKLGREGLFDKSRKRKLPFLPDRIGIVTSPAGSVLKDMLGIISRRWPGVEIIISPAAVQGESAPRELCEALERLNRVGVDVVIIGRGGGSLEELWAFNTEPVARSIFNSSAPVISAVGHDTDFTIADLVADVRAPTPSAAAELVVPDRRDVQLRLEALKARLVRSLLHLLKDRWRRLQAVVKSRSFVKPVDFFCGQKRQAVDGMLQMLIRQMDYRLEKEKNLLASLAGRLQALSPLKTLARGYCVCTDESGGIVRDAGQVRTGDKVSVHLHRGKLECEVKEVLAMKNLNREGF